MRQYERLHASGEAPPYGYSRERITCALVLSHAGEPVAVLPLFEACAQSPARRLCEVPHPVRRTSRPSANFLWDKTAYVFGVKRHPVTRRPCPANGEHDAFRDLHETLLSGAEDDGLQALAALPARLGSERLRRAAPCRSHAGLECHLPARRRAGLAPRAPRGEIGVGGSPGPRSATGRCVSRHRGSGPDRARASRGQGSPGDPRRGRSAG